MSEPRRSLAAARGNVRLAGATVIAAVVGSLYQLGAARVLGPALFSDLAVCLSLSYVALMFLGPLNLTLIRFSGAYRHTNNADQIRPLLAHAARLYAPWIVGAIVLSVVLASPIADALNIGSPALVPWTGVLIGLGVALGAVRATAIGLNEQRLYTSGSVVMDALVRFGAGGLLLFTYRSAGAALAGFLIGGAAALLVLGALTRRLLPAPERPWTESAEMSAFMTRALVFSAILSGLQNVDMIGAKWRLDSDSAGDYAVVLAIARGFLLLASPFAVVALARPAPAGAPAGFWARLLHTPVVAYGAMCIPVLVVLTAVPEAILGLLFGAHVASRSELLPVLSAALAFAGAFAILAHGEIRAGRFGFLAPVLITLAGEVIVLAFAPINAIGVAWTVLGAHAAAIGFLFATPLLFARLRRFEGSATYWDQRYERGGTSGDGSLGKFASFKAEVLNDFVARHGVGSVIEFGCGDGRQLSLASYASYLGFDVSPEAVRICRERFLGDGTKTFGLVADYAGQRADVTLSLDVIYLLIEDDIFHRYMALLFDASDRWVIIYSSNHDGSDWSEARHVRHRQFRGWIAVNRPEWTLRAHVPNRYPFTGDYRLGSFSEFFIFERS